MFEGSPYFCSSVLLHYVAPGSGMLAPQWQCIPHRGCLGAIVVRGTTNRFFTHLSNCFVVVVVVPAGVVLAADGVAGVILSDVTTVIGAKVHV